MSPSTSYSMRAERPVRRSSRSLSSNVPGARAEQAHHDLAVGERGVVVRNLAQTRALVVGRRARRRRAAEAVRSWGVTADRASRERIVPQRTWQRLRRAGVIPACPAGAPSVTETGLSQSSVTVAGFVLSSRCRGDFPMKLQSLSARGRAGRWRRGLGPGADGDPVVALDDRRQQRLGQRPGQGLQREPEGLQDRADLQGLRTTCPSPPPSPPSAPARRRTSCRCSRSAPRR